MSTLPWQAPYLHLTKLWNNQGQSLLTRLYYSETRNPRFMEKCDPILQNVLREVERHGPEKVPGGSLEISVRKQLQNNGKSTQALNSINALIEEAIVYVIEACSALQNLSQALSTPHPSLRSVQASVAHLRLDIHTDLILIFLTIFNSVFQITFLLQRTPHFSAFFILLQMMSQSKADVQNFIIESDYGKNMIGFLQGSLTNVFSIGPTIVRAILPYLEFDMHRARSDARLAPAWWPELLRPLTTSMAAATQASTMRTSTPPSYPLLTSSKYAPFHRVDLLDTLRCFIVFLFAVKTSWELTPDMTHALSAVLQRNYVVTIFGNEQLQIHAFLKSLYRAVQNEKTGAAVLKYCSSTLVELLQTSHVTLPSRRLALTESLERVLYALRYDAKVGWGSAAYILSLVALSLSELKHMLRHWSIEPGTKNKLSFYDARDWKNVPHFNRLLVVLIDVLLIWQSSTPSLRQYTRALLEKVCAPSLESAARVLAQFLKDTSRIADSTLVRVVLPQVQSRSWEALPVSLLSDAMSETLACPSMVQVEDFARNALWLQIFHKCAAENTGASRNNPFVHALASMLHFQEELLQIATDPCTSRCLYIAKLVELFPLCEDFRFVATENSDAIRVRFAGFMRKCVMSGIDAHMRCIVENSLNAEIPCLRGVTQQEGSKSTKSRKAPSAMSTDKTYAAGLGLASKRYTGRLHISRVAADVRRFQALGFPTQVYTSPKNNLSRLPSFSNPLRSSNNLLSLYSLQDTSATERQQTQGFIMTMYEVVSKLTDTIYTGGTWTRLPPTGIKEKRSVIATSLSVTQDDKSTKGLGSSAGELSRRRSSVALNSLLNTSSTPSMQSSMTTAGSSPTVPNATAATNPEPSWRVVLQQHPEALSNAVVWHPLLGKKENTTNQNQRRSTRDERGTAAVTALDIECFFTYHWTYVRRSLERLSLYYSIHPSFQIASAQIMSQHAQDITSGFLDSFIEASGTKDATVLKQRTFLPSSHSCLEFSKALQGGVLASKGLSEMPLLVSMGTLQRIQNVVGEIRMSEMIQEALNRSLSTIQSNLIKHFSQKRNGSPIEGEKVGRDLASLGVGGLLVSFIPSEFVRSIIRRQVLYEPLIQLLVDSEEFSVNTKSNKKGLTLRIREQGAELVATMQPNPFFTSKQDVGTLDRKRNYAEFVMGLRIFLHSCHQSAGSTIDPVAIYSNEVITNMIGAMKLRKAMDQPYTPERESSPSSTGALHRVATFLMDRKGAQANIAALEQSVLWISACMGLSRSMRKAAQIYLPGPMLEPVNPSLYV